MSEPRRILIGDSNLANVEQYTAYLSVIECTFATASHGTDVLDRIDDFRPHLVLLNLSIENAIDTCKKIKAEHPLDQMMVLTIIELTEADIERAVEAGTDDFIAQPVDREELLRRVQNMLKLYDLSP